ncbi:MAG: hypothetical protein A3F43_01985 [Gammaproteobacteria bacterium RIFCSPHIGHO2_12_FULL_42_10]|nr:MAG: hypothetical protein A3F43_01985 [Gammaproteobacteria bacterium RIFCSPHIGHO2_12_FULL_42_10]
MAETRNPFLEQSTTEQLIALKRDIKREINLRVQRQHSFLAAPRDTSQPSAEEKKLAAQLLAYVDKSEYDNIEKMWKLKPDLMFVEIKDKDGVLTTPLKRALYKIDTWTWKPFYEWIQENKQNQPYLADLELKFLQQNDAQKKHVDLNYLQPLSDEYAVYDTQVQKWYRNEITDAEIDREWKKLFEKQCEILPFHMIREMCREGNGLWSPESRFDAKTAPKGGRVYDYTVGSYIKLDSDEFLSRFGSSLGFVRGGAVSGAWMWAPAFGAGSARDADSIRQLCKVRTSDLASIPTLAQTEEKISTLRK